MRAPLSSLEQRSYDAIVIGGGAAGASSAQHLASQGYSTLLVDQGDFASGTSSRSSRLLYCGLAYFSPDYELWRFAYRPRDLLTRVRMAKLAMECRTQLMRTMPKRLNKHTFFFPVYRDSKYLGWKVDLGYKALGLFGSRDAPLNYRRIPAEAAADQFGLIRLMDRSRLESVGVFTEYQFNWAERICVDTVLDAERCGATVRNYTKAVKLERMPGSSWQVTLEDTQMTGSTAQVRGGILINAAGPWADQVNAQAVRSPRKRLVGIKGVNIMVKLPDGCRGLGMETISSIGQPFYCMPWGKYHFFGPTETVFDGNPEDVRVLPEEVAFILNEANTVFPSLALSQKDIIYSWSGVRPRTASTGHEGVKSLTIHDMSDDGMPNALTVTGTPIMLHRHAGRAVVSKVKQMRRPSQQGRTLSYGAKLPPDNQNSLPISYDYPEVKVADLRHAAAHEHVETLVDLLFRRVSLGWAGDMGLSSARAAAEAIADIVGWDDERVTAEVLGYARFVQEHFNPAQPASALG
ncbi:FAD-dependent oxidoreductase [Microvirga aerilata]|uniref:FAD-dependent oxidoreductase n=1 Tax=Microvirga aerilata TaxID=670292 RepID=A0A936ZHS5_9HYPH|nr:FAD-dependent oxidoreductase [Microvirga aerilata]MBL0406160.1 FAD-dependent oxidoreductase [Microvirga aerilata]